MLPNITVRCNVWLEVDGKVALSAWRVELLQAVAETGSISAAAERMGVSYRRAWEKLHECEERLGVKLLQTQTGGSGGGGTTLTLEGLEVVERFAKLTNKLESAVVKHYQRVFLEQAPPTDNRA